MQCYVLRILNSENTIIPLNTLVPYTGLQLHILLFNLLEIYIFLLKKTLSEKEEIDSILVSSGNNTIPNQSWLFINIARNGATQLLSEENMKTKNN